MLIAKADVLENQGGAIVVSFEASWLDSIRKKLITRVIRKRVPKTNNPRFLYVYVNSPVGALVARAKISKLSAANIATALKHAKTLCLSPKEIKAYIGPANEVGMYQLESIQLASKPMTLHELRSAMTFHPPQSFFFLSREAQSVIDQKARFGRA